MIKFNMIEDNILELLRIKPAPESIDYVNKKKEFHLHHLITEQPHPKTKDLSLKIKKNTIQGLQLILSVDEDISFKILQLSKNFEELKNIEDAVHAVEKAIMDGRKIYIYGCGSTGRLAKFIESALWRPFWKKLKSSNFWERIKNHIPENVEENLIGEMTGGDRALVSSLEGLEDLQLMGQLQLQERGISREDVIFAITEGGETSSVIGTVLGAIKQYSKNEDKKVNTIKGKIFFIYNNPNEVLKNLKRSRMVIKNKFVTKINLTTGPQAIAGSTRMQATTVDTYIMGIIIEEALFRILNRFLSQSELLQLGFSPKRNLIERITDFVQIQKFIFNLSGEISKLTDIETETYKSKHFSVYFARKAILTVFIDIAERSPTFKLDPLDPVDALELKSWVRVWIPATDYKDAWVNMLGRPFRGLNPILYKKSIARNVKDNLLRTIAIKSLDKTGQTQEMLYDFSFSKFNIEHRGVKEGDLGIIILLDDELDELLDPSSTFRKFISLCKNRGANVALLLVTKGMYHNINMIRDSIKELENDDIIILVPLELQEDALGLRQHIALKMLLNAHSTAIMAKLGRVIGNLMVNVQPTNLKLIGRATNLILNIVNDTISRKSWIVKYGKVKPLTYAEANAILFDAINFVKKLKKSGQIPEVALSIIRIIETLKMKKYVKWEKALKILENKGLENFIQEILCSQNLGQKQKNKSEN